MSRPLSTTMWCPAVKVGTRWQLAVHFMGSTRRDCERTMSLMIFHDSEVKYVKVRIQEVQGAGFLVSKGGKK